jgi:NRPS condensation-like uncharacterized protein
MDTIELEAQEVSTVLHSRAKKTLNLSQQCFDTCLYRVNAEHHVWFLNQHHIITDARAFAALFKQLECYYLGQKPRLPERFFDQLKLEEKSRNSAHYQAAKNYWATQCKHSQTKKKWG